MPGKHDEHISGTSRRSLRFQRMPCQVHMQSKPPKKRCIRHPDLEQRAEAQGAQCSAGGRRAQQIYRARFPGTCSVGQRNDKESVDVQRAGAAEPMWCQIDMRAPVAHRIHLGQGAVQNLTTEAISRAIRDRYYRGLKQRSLIFLEPLASFGESSGHQCVKYRRWNIEIGTLP